MKFIDLDTQLEKIRSNVIESFEKVLDHGAFISGQEITELEDKLAKYTGAKHAIAVSSGTDALLIALMAIGIKPGDEVITTPFSFFATAEVILLLGAKPVFVDIDRHTYNIDHSLIEKAITKNTKAIIPVNIFGQCADFDEINAIASKHNLVVIEDAAQSFGATYKDRQSCNLSTISCTSFFPSKPLGCYGDGGACFTSDDDLAKKMREIVSHGQAKRYYHTSVGINGRCDTIQAAILLEKFKIFPKEVVARQHIVKRYNRLLENHVKKPFVKESNMSVYAQYTVEVENREFVQKKLQEAGIPTAVHYPLGLHKQPIINELYPSTQSFSHTDFVADRVLSLPMHPYLSEEDQDNVCNALVNILTTQALEVC
jgi:UDP-2-acetamido-2-deoxy-ribo-hexuluronate aminotransferase